MGEKVLRGLQRSPFLAINVKGGEIIKPKAKGPHHHHFKKIRNKVLIAIFSNWYSSRVSFSFGIYISPD
jgi:hypothetical protein